MFILLPFEHLELRGRGACLRPTKHTGNIVALDAPGPTTRISSPTINVSHGVLSQVVTEQASAPFAIVTGRETTSSDYEGISMDLMKVGRDAKSPGVRSVGYPCTEGTFGRRTELTEVSVSGTGIFWSYQVTEVSGTGNYAEPNHTHDFGNG